MHFADSVGISVAAVDQIAHLHLGRLEIRCSHHSHGWAAAASRRFGRDSDLNRPQNQFSGHEIWRGSSPFFLTGRLDDLMMVKPGVSCTDLAMLRKRLKVFEFRRSQINPDITIPRCASCFAKMILRRECFAKMILRKGNPRCIRFITPDLQEQAPGEVVVDYF